MTPADVSGVIKSGFFGKGYPIENFAYNSDGYVEYIGIAPQGSLGSQAVWLIKKLTYDVTNTERVTQSRISPSQSVWDDRASTTYS